MLEALALARLALGNVSPNPAVGAVIVKDGVIIGQGYTQPPGKEHAEIVALRQAGENAQGASLFVTLEPCCHFGRTPPCTRAIIQSGVREVVAAMTDPNPVVAGKGFQELEEAGVKTVVGVAKEEATEINEAYIKHTLTGLPFVTAKFAMSLDGKIAAAGGDSKWISSASSRSYSHILRHHHDAIMAGINTVLKDNPHLTVRCGSGRGGTSHQQPTRVIIDSYGRTPLDAQILHESGSTIIAVGQDVSNDRKTSLKNEGATLIELPSVNGYVDLELLIEKLGKMQITSIMVEGGSSIMGSMFDHKLVDKVVAFIAPIIIGGQEAKTPVGGIGVEKISWAPRLENIKIERFEDDVMVKGYIRKH